MLRAGFIVTLMTIAGSAQAQAIPQIPAQPQGAPEVTLSADDKVIVQQALDKFSMFLKKVGDHETPMRVRDIEHELQFATGPLDLRSVPIVGMALSRNSQDSAACALLKRIEPSAVCVK